MVSWLICVCSIWVLSIAVLCGFVRASFVGISSGFSPHALMISLRASILLMRVFGFIESPEASGNT